MPPAPRKAPPWRAAHERQLQDRQQDEDGDEDDNQDRHRFVHGIVLQELRHIAEERRYVALHPESRYIVTGHSGLATVPGRVDRARRTVFPARWLRDI
ncbi:hypothetical protein GCM10022252_40360 [Streptosporangium oxazolinicum]|uniref:Uncharacterized protein n=1 Tax=Streptosporangium oxazolinicum TaxID=909287 RepID=A0ABP8B0N1_9ACTN